MVTNHAKHTVAGSTMAVGGTERIGVCTCAEEGEPSKPANLSNTKGRRAQAGSTVKAGMNVCK